MPGGTPSKSTRNQRILQLREVGMSFAEISRQLEAEGFNLVSRQRVRGLYLRMQGKEPQRFVMSHKAAWEHYKAGDDDCPVCRGVKG